MLAQHTLGAPYSSQFTAAIRDVQLFDPAHYSVTALYGSRAGGTRLRLIGNDLLLPDGSFDTSIIVTIAGEQATLIPFLSTDKQLVIDTPPKPPASPDCCYSVRVRLQQLTAFPVDTCL